MMKKTTITILLVVGIVIFINLVAKQYFFRLDFTEDQQYTMSKATKEILKDLKNPITVKAYFSEDLPPNISKVRKNFKEFLIEYSRLSGDNIVYKFINPSESEEQQKEAISAGIQPVMINVREKDKVKQQKAFLGATLEYGNKKEVIPFMQPSTPLEYSLSTAIKKMILKDKPYIAILQGQGEPSLDELAEVKSNLGILYNVEPLEIKNTTSIPEKYKTLAIIRPKDSISEKQLTKLDAFLKRGGNIFVALNRVKGNLQTSMGSVVNTNFETWLTRNGITVEDKFIVDSNSGSVTIQQQQGMFRIQTNAKFPYLPIISNFADHPVTKGLEAALMQFVSPLKPVVNDSLAKFTPLAFTSDYSGTRPALTYFDFQKQWSNADFPLKRLPVAGVLTRTYLKTNTTSRLLVVGDGDFPVGGTKEQPKPLQPDNLNLMVNAIDWLSDDTGLIGLRTKGIRYRPIDDLQESTKALLKYMNFLLPILILVIYGLIRVQINRNKRIKLMQENYE